MKINFLNETLCDFNVTTALFPCILVRTFKTKQYYEYEAGIAQMTNHKMYLLFFQSPPLRLSGRKLTAASINHKMYYTASTQYIYYAVF